MVMNRTPFEWGFWYAKARIARTRSGAIFSLKTFRLDIPIPHRGPDRNPLIFARELHEEMLLHNLSRVQLGQRYGVTSDRITQWLHLLKLSEKTEEDRSPGRPLGQAGGDREGTEETTVMPSDREMCLICSRC